MFSFYGDREYQQPYTVKIWICSGVVVLDGFETAAEYHAEGIHTFLTDSLGGEYSIHCGRPVDDSLTVTQLKSICTQLSLSTEGTQQELIDRIKEHLGI